jgi:hypothetical protein
MSRDGSLVLGGIVLAAVVLGAVGWAWARSRDPATASPSPGSSAPAGPSGSALAAIATPSPTPSTVPSARPTASATTPPRTSPPRATGDPRLAYAEFLLRLNDDRATVERLNATLTDAVKSTDTDATQAAAVNILDFVDQERVWLIGHPPADCYAAAHDAALSMLEAYGTAAERFVDWAATGGGLGGLPALGTALDAANVATDALTALGHALEGTTCRA